MPRFFINNDNIDNTANCINIIGKDINHIKNVLRAKINDNIEICNVETSNSYLCKIEEINKFVIKAKIINELIENKNIYDNEKGNSASEIEITIFQGLPKADKMELIIQKSVELGCFDIYPIEMKRCIVKLNEKDKIKKINRWQNISEVAAKQCGRNLIPKINDIININKISDLMLDYDLILLAYEKENNNTLKNELKILKNKIIENNKNKQEEIVNNYKIGIIIGPEGGLDEIEVENLRINGAKVITLGKRILRTETAALNVISNITYELEI